MVQKEQNQEETYSHLAGGAVMTAVGFYHLTGVTVPHSCREQSIRCYYHGLVWGSRATHSFLEGKGEL